MEIVMVVMAMACKTAALGKWFEFNEMQHDASADSEDPEWIAMFWAVEKELKDRVVLSGIAWAGVLFLGY